MPFREDSKKLLEAYGIPVTRPRAAATPAEAVAAAAAIGYPVVLKICFARHHPQDRRRRRGARPGRRRGGAGGLRAHHGVGRAPASRRRGSRESPCSPWSAPRRRVELILGTKQGPGLRRRDPGRAWAGSRPSCSRTAPSASRRSTSGWPAACSNRCAPGRCCTVIAAGRRSHVDRLIEILIRFSYLVGRLSRRSTSSTSTRCWSGPTRVIALDARSRRSASGSAGR